MVYWKGNLKGKIDFDYKTGRVFILSLQGAKNTPGIQSLKMGISLQTCFSKARYDVLKLHGLGGRFNELRRIFYPELFDEVFPVRNRRVIANKEHIGYLLGGEAIGYQT